MKRNVFYGLKTLTMVYEMFIIAFETPMMAHEMFIIGFKTLMMVYEMFIVGFNTIGLYIFFLHLRLL